MSKTKFFYYGTEAFVFLLYWGLFGFIWNWWGGLMVACVLTALQYAMGLVLRYVQTEELPPRE